MPTLEELRRWGTGQKVEGLPARDPLKTGPTREEKLARVSSRATHSYKINSEGTDALLQFGRHKGEQVSDISEDPNKRGYLRWLRKQVRTDDNPSGFDEALIDVVNYVLKSTSTGVRL